MLPLSFSGLAQETNKVRIENADTLHYIEKDDRKIRKLIGNVQFFHEGKNMFCDSAYQFEDKSLIKAFSDIRILQGDTMELTGEYLEYTGNDEMAMIEEDVVLIEDTMRLETDRLYYDFHRKVAYYKTGAQIDVRDNDLTSKKGYYHSNTRDLYFRDSVALVNPEYTMEGDTLRYNTSSAKAYFYGPTTIISDSNFIYCENGWYNTKVDVAQFGKNAYINSDSRYLYADSIYYDRNLGYGRGISDVKIQDTAEKLNVYGEYAEYYEDPENSYITDSTLAEKIKGNDTFYLHADTIFLYKDTSGHRYMEAYYGVESYHRDFQSKCDSMIYSFRDSIIHLYNNPVLWHEEYQSTSDSMKLYTKPGGLERIEMLNDAFITFQVDTNRFNQIKGRNMTGYLTDNELNKVNVSGNGQSVYYLKDEQEQYIGVNKITSSDIEIRIENRNLHAINFVEEPKATLYPLTAKTREELRLKGFHWRGSERPLKVNDLFLP